MKDLSYYSCFPEVENIEDDEKYALISHSIQLKGKFEADRYISALREKGMVLSTVIKKSQFCSDCDIELVPHDEKFTFIDLFAGIGGFRIAMQDVGGTCVFSSEWDVAAKETYFRN